jgi:DNA-binding MurR/RpiR family transcriptional regulator
MTRLLQALDFDAYQHFQAEHRQWLTGEQDGVFSSRAGRLISGTRAPGAEEALLDAIAGAEQANVAAAMAPQARAALREAADMLLAAPAVAVLGIRSCFPVAFSLHYTLSLFMPGVRLMTGIGGSPLDELHHLHEGDVMVAITVAPYSRETVEAARYSRRRKVRLIAISDGNLTPVSRIADTVLVAANDSPAHIASPIGPLAVVQALASLTLARAGENALKTMRAREAALEATSAYLSETVT